MNNDLRVFCGGIADAIRTKKGTTDKINAQAFAEEILTIESGGSGDGAVIEYGAIGTVVPNTGYVEKVYLNTNLSYTEVEALLSQLPYSNSAPIVILDSENAGIQILNAELKIIMGLNNVMYWCNDVASSAFGLPHSGWQDFTNPVEVNSEVSSVYMESVIVGEQNDLLTSLFSITPFGKATKTLSGTYDGSSIDVSENGTVDVSALIDEKKIPLKIKVNVEGSKQITIKCIGYVGDSFNAYIYPDCQDLLTAENTLNIDNHTETNIDFSLPEKVNVNGCVAIKTDAVLDSVENGQYTTVTIGEYSVYIITGDDVVVSFQKTID